MLSFIFVEFLKLETLLSFTLSNYTKQCYKRSIYIYKTLEKKNWVGYLKLDMNKHYSLVF